jgi:XRE family transcriptional regulator, aerobic/anaerobic benzoate catabolism transcriptional regulator
LLESLGERVRALRTARGWSQRALCAEAGLSPRYLVQLEAGQANVSLNRLAPLAKALGVSLVSLLAGLGTVRDPADRMASALLSMSPDRQRELLRSVDPRPAKLSLIGLRGAGKTTIGRRVATSLNCPFILLDDWVQDQAGMSLAEIFEFHGADRYRQLCVTALRQILDDQPGVLEVGGSVVQDPDAWDLLHRHSRVIWLQATPEEHLRRVFAQGDLRPMEGRGDALGEIRTILQSRASLYARADTHIDTHATGIEGAVRAVLASFSHTQQAP